MSNHTRGFTLLEVLITLGIISILSCIASASYQHYVIKTARTNAKIALFSTAAALENYYNRYHTYAGASLSKLGVLSLTDDERYQIVLSQCTSTHYLVTAMPKGAQTKDKQCGALMLNGKGEQLISGLSTIKRCWL